MAESVGGSGPRSATMNEMQTMHKTTAELQAGLDGVRAAPSDGGTLELIVRRPAVGEREILDEAELSGEHGLVGDGWRERGSRHTPDGSAEPDRQLTLMSTRALALLCDERGRWPLAGDQLLVDLDLSPENLPAGTRLQLGEAVVSISEVPHTGCAKFRDRFGVDAARFVNSPDGLALRLRGVNARVVQDGRIRAGDRITKLS